MLVNNETGTIQPVQAAREAVKRTGCPALIHCDAVQAFCKIPINPFALGADIISVSSHKIHGPKGCGALYIRKGTRILPMMFGGGQENGLRPGTESTPLIAGFGAAADVALKCMDDNEIEITQLKNYLTERLSDIPGILINSPSDAIANILNFSVQGIRSETLLNFLSSEKIYVSSGSACSKGKMSHVLTSMGLTTARVDSAIRVSFGRFNTKRDVERLAEEVKKATSTLVRTAVKN